MTLNFKSLKMWLVERKRQIVLASGLAILAGLQMAQVFYPNDRLLPFTKIDDRPVGGQVKTAVADQLDRAYANAKISVYLGEQKATALSPSFSEIGTKISNHERIQEIDYPWYLRLVPTSLFWIGPVSNTDEAKVDYNPVAVQSYIDKKADKACRLSPKSASLKPSGDSLELIPAEFGLSCDLGDLKKALLKLKPSISSGQQAVHIDASQLAPSVDNQAAEALAEQLEAGTNGGVTVVAAGQNVIISQAEVLGWLDFMVNENQLTTVINAERAADFLAKNIAPKVAVASGISRITTRNFAITERQDGPAGRSLDASATLDQILKVARGEAEVATAATVTVPPKVEYTRLYSSTDEGLNALLTNFAKDNPGTYGISLIELGGKRRRAEHNPSQQFVTASTYKLFVAYSVLLRVESGKFNWSDPVVGSRNLETCFDDMIAKSDNPCAEALLAKIGFRDITKDIDQLGLKNTTFLKGDRPLTTAGDLATFLATLESGQMLQPTSRQRLIDSMKRSIHRQGIPAGVNAQTAGKVGFLDKYLHDARIVYSGAGTYVLSVMSEGSSWAKIAELTREIEKLRSS